MTYESESNPVLSPGRLGRVPLIRRWNHHCDHRWSEPALMGVGVSGQPAIFGWTCLACGKRARSGRIV